MPIVSFKDKNQTLTLEENEIIFDGFDSQGEKLPHGCLAGSCGACRIEILEGSENLKPPSSIEKNTIESIKASNSNFNEKIIRLACRTRVLGEDSKIVFQILK